MSNLDYKPYYRRNLPHIQPPGATFFVTFRLTGTVPKAVRDEWAEEKRRFDVEPARDDTPEKRADRDLEFRRRRFAQMEKYLDKAEHGPTWLKDVRIAKLIAESMNYRHGKVYELVAFSIMPNHVHIVFTPLAVAQAGSLCAPLPVAQADSLCDPQAASLCYVSLAAILHSLKGYTARAANQLLNRMGEFWEHESYDHYVRDEAELERIVRYVLDNPFKAGLVPPGGIWPWNYSRFAVA